MRLLRTHTYWQPHFTFELSNSGVREQMLQEIWQMLSRGQHGRAELRSRTPTTMVVALDDLFVIQLRIEQSLSLSFEQKLLVPAHLYDKYRQRLARLTESIAQVANPKSVQCGVVVSFEAGTRNPYYGLFVNHVQPELLDEFDVSFRVDSQSSCRVEADKDCVNIESHSLVELFDVLTTVVTFRALPAGRNL
jgi:hypothetical protein